MLKLSYEQEEKTSKKEASQEKEEKCVFEV
jgi:hypothetical protein